MQSFSSYANKPNFHRKSFVLSLAFIVRFKAFTLFLYWGMTKPVRSAEKNYKYFINLAYLSWSSEWHFVDVHVLRYSGSCCGSVTRNDVHYTRGKPSLHENKKHNLSEKTWRNYLNGHSETNHDGGGGEGKKEGGPPLSKVTPKMKIKEDAKIMISLFCSKVLL